MCWTAFQTNNWLLHCILKEDEWTEMPRYYIKSRIKEDYSDEPSIMKISKEKSIEISNRGREAILKKFSDDN